MSTFTVSAPVTEFNGVVGGVWFRDGAAQVDASQVSALAYFRRAGYTVTPTEEEEPASAEPAKTEPTEQSAETDTTDKQPNRAKGATK